MSTCLKGHLHEGFVSTPKPLILIGKSKPVHYLPPFFFLVCMCVCLCNIYWFGYSHKYDFPFFSVGKPVPLKNLQGQIDGQTLRQMEMFNKFLHLVEGLRWIDLTWRLQPSLFLYMGKCSFFIWEFSFHWHWVETKKQYLSFPPPRQQSQLWWMQFKWKMGRVQLSFLGCTAGLSTSVLFNWGICPSPYYYSIGRRQMGYFRPALE